MALSQKDERRFWSKVRVRFGACYIWTGRASNGQRPGMGHRKFCWKDRGAFRIDYAHRVMYRLLVGPIPPGKQVLHHCDNPRCVKPSHLYLGTPADNVADMVRRGRMNQARGERAGHSKLVPRQVRAIHRRLAAGVAAAALAREYGLCSRSVRKIRDGASWAHLGLGAVNATAASR